MSVLASETQNKVSSCRTALVAVEKHLEPLLAKSLAEVSRKLAPMENAELQVGLAYTVASLYFCHLLTQGVDPSEHPIRQELDRIQLYFKKLKTTAEEIRDKEAESTRLRVDADVVKRVVQHYTGAVEAAAQRQAESSSSSSGLAPQPTQIPEQATEGSPRKKRKVQAAAKASEEGPASDPAPPESAAQSQTAIEAEPTCTAAPHAVSSGSAEDTLSIGAGGGNAIAEAMPKCPNLQTLDIGNTGIGAEEQKAEQKTSATTAGSADSPETAPVPQTEAPVAIEAAEAKSPPPVPATSEASEATKAAPPAPYLATTDSATATAPVAKTSTAVAKEKAPQAKVAPPVKASASAKAKAQLAPLANPMAAATAAKIPQGTAADIIVARAKADAAAVKKKKKKILKKTTAAATAAATEEEQKAEGGAAEDPYALAVEDPYA